MFYAPTDEQITRAIKKLKPYKAAGPDGIPNAVFTHCRETLVPWLGKLFRATFSLKYYPHAWKIFDTHVIRKPGKADYTVAKSYRPIALLKTMPKILSSMVGKIVTYHAESLQLLPNTHFGC